MAKTAKVTVKFGSEGVEQVNADLDKLERKATSVFAKLPKELRQHFDDTQKALGGAIESAIKGAVTDAAGAIAGPAKSTFAGVLASANQYRREVTGIAVATGKDFGAVSAKVDQVSKNIGEMPSKTIGWAREVKRLTGNFDAAMDSVAEFKNVALALDKPLEATADQAARLGGSFGIKNQDQVRHFFGVMNAQAQSTGVSFARLNSQWEAFSGSFAKMSGKGASAFSGLTAAFAGSSADPEQAQRNQGFGMGVLNQGVRLVEMRMRNAGKLGKGEYITDESGEVDPKKYLAAMKFMQKDMLRFYGGSKKRAIEVQAGEDLEARRTVGGFLNTDLSKVDKLSDLSPEALKAADKYFGLDEGKRRRADVNKELKDKDAGMGMIKAQDAAVEVGGGAAGLTMSAASGVFSTAVDKFGGFVKYLPAALRGIATVAGGKLAAASGAGLAGYVAYKGLDSLSPDSEFAKGVHSRQKQAAGHELAGRAKTQGWITPEIYNAAGGDKEVIQNMLKELSAQKLPSDFAKQVAQAMADKTLTVRIDQGGVAPDGEASGG